ncbi:MAG: hypothetical protein WDM94_12605 [Bauldia sp.]
MADSEFSLLFNGRDARANRLDLYDASQSYYGLARVLSILGQYYINGSIISQAPTSQLALYLVPPEEGSFKQTVIAGVVTSIISVPFTVFITKVVESWIPSESPQLSAIVAELQENNRLLRERPSSVAPAITAQQEATVSDHMQAHTNEMQVLRSITSSSFRSIFRPIGRSADTVAILAGPTQQPVGVVDAGVLARIEADEIDDDVKTVVGVVNSFSRSSKTGVMFSEDMGRGFRFEYDQPGKLERQDIFSWSQFYGRKIEVDGRFVRFFDQTIKKFIVYRARKFREEE